MKISHLLAAGEDFLIDLCRRIDREEGMTGGHEAGNRVVKLSDQKTAKFGEGVTASEDATQKLAHTKLDPARVRVPKVHRFFESTTAQTGRRVAYLLMEYVPGRTPTDADLDCEKRAGGLVSRFAGIIASLATIRGSIPGPLDDGLSDGTIDLSPHPLVLCHSDLYRRNMIILNDDDDNDGLSIFLVDWGPHGVLPAVL
ncbi:hypothetical protein BJY01DRAFT_247846 [Aspergillus pseudoustus]|uniref:Aminoglycoside phosphotransferase domain-containing protein n=1 Tax=Aspergillus pseudoustus TaxID=1810923 RepID=A0ABR4JZP1_9EURO